MAEIGIVSGCFTTENNVLGKSTSELERTLGFRPGRLDAGAKIWALDRVPQLHEFLPLGSTRFSGGEGLNLARLAATRAIPGAWLNRRLVKVTPNTPHTDVETYPSALGGAAEQWRLVVPMPARVVQVLARGQIYRGR